MPKEAREDNPISLVSKRDMMSCPKGASALSSARLRGVVQEGNRLSEEGAQ